jgi:hypothetical protein
MRGHNDDYGVNGCYGKPQNHQPKHAAEAASVVDNHEVTNQYPAREHSTEKHR